MRKPAALSLLVSLATVALATPARATDAAHPIAPVDGDELVRLVPLLARGPVITGRMLGCGAAARTTLHLRIHAPRDVVRRVITTPERYGEFMPSVQHVEVRERHAGYTAFRLQARAAVFDVAADAVMREVGTHRVDIDIPGSPFGAAGSRWELRDDGPDATIASLTVWSDPASASWAVQQLVGNSGWASSSADITAQTVLALATARQAERLAGATLPLRPTLAHREPATLAPPAAGDWLHTSEDATVISMALDPDGALSSVSVAGWFPRTPEQMRARLDEPRRSWSLGDWWTDIGSVHDANGLSVFDASLGAPFEHAHGTLARTWDDAGHTLRLDGIAGAFTGEHRRWDVLAADRGGLYAVYTSGTDAAHPSGFQRVLMDRDPWVAAGVNAYWSTVALRDALGGW